MHEASINAQIQILNKIRTVVKIKLSGSKLACGIPKCFYTTNKNAPEEFVKTWRNVLKLHERQYTRYNIKHL